MNCAAVILAGGKSRRIGTDKALLTLEDETFLERIRKELARIPDLRQVLLSVGSVRRYAELSQKLEARGLPLEIVPDRWSDCGPIGGIASALEVCICDALLVVSCDMPLFCGELGEILKAGMTEAYDAAVPVDSAGRLHPVCAVYRKGVGTILREQIESGELRMHKLMERIRVNDVDVRDYERCLQNVNTMEDYERLQNGGNAV
ncbi:MAG: molybdenum cofactor guanylyltransferase [Lachnospiraceae bacterium]|nr:molybdenum cofactor guanylyltransferase [Lachnospiraceae bacterium]